MTLVRLDGEDESISVRTGDPHSRRIRCVCRACNTGWMSRLQEAAKPFLVPLLLGHATSLHRRAQKVIATWVAMKVMVDEHVRRAMIAIPYAEREYLRTKLIVPPHWRIWLGRHARRDHPLFTHRVMDFVATKEEFDRRGGPSARAEGNTQTSTICLGEHLIIFVMSSETAWSLIRRYRIPAPIGSDLTQIWPIETSRVPWPPSRTLLDAGIALLADDFFDKVTAIIRERGTS